MQIPGIRVRRPPRCAAYLSFILVLATALALDSAGALPDSRPFRDVRELKQILVLDERQIARNLARQLTVFATGAPVRVADREEVEKILDATKPGRYGVRSLVHAIVQSELFRNK